MSRTPPPYVPPPWLPGNHAQTIWPLTIKGTMPRVERERWESPDGDFIHVDFLPHRPGKPLVVLFHGLEGSSRSHYARALLRAVHALGWNGAIPHFRGCSGEPNLLPRAYHSGDAAEIDWILRRLAPRFADVPRYASGVSLGGNALLCWLGQQGAAARGIVDSAAAVCAPLDLTACGHHLSRGFNQLYTRHFLWTLKQTALGKLERFPGMYDGQRVRSARNLYEFDDVVTARLHGFTDAADYWKRASAKPWLKQIELPTLLLNARNDPFIPRSVYPGPGEVGPSVVLDQPAAGGHVGFVSGPFPGNLDWLPQRLLHFFEHQN
jgi:predicted alpha/beta-fold hydrolase